jgi:hypothetical protein
VNPFGAEKTGAYRLLYPVQHHYDSYSLSPSTSLEIFVHTHSAIDTASVEKTGLTIRDVRYATLLDHLYHAAYAAGAESSDGGLDPGLDEEVVERLLS